MAFRETDRKLRGASAPGVAERWLREVLFEDWWLKLVALCVALAIWFGVTSQRVPATSPLRDVPLAFLLPEDVEISNDPLDRLKVVTLQGRKDELDRLDRHNLVATVDVTDYRLGERVVRLSPESVTMNLPAGVRVEKIEPDSIPLRLERRIEREVKVAPRLEGRPAEGHEVRGWQVTPHTVRVRGPESHVMRMEEVPTETISLEGQTQALELRQIAVDINDPKVVALTPVVSVRLDIGEERVERRFDNVAVREAGGEQTSHASVRLRGPRPLLDQLRAEQITVVLERAPDGSTQPRLQLPPDANGRVELVSMNQK